MDGKISEPKQVNKLTVSASPHLRDGETISKIMWNVNLALLPAALFGILNFGLPAFITLLICIAASVGTEALIQVFQKKPVTVSDGSAFLTGLLLGMSVPANLPFYVPLIGAAAAIGIAKHTLGGLGFNIFNPAHVGRALMLLSYPIVMTTWSISRLGSGPDFQGALGTFAHLDALTSATPLAISKLQGHEALIQAFGSQSNLYQALLIGNRGGSIGETSAILLLLGGLFLIFKGYIKWQVPVFMIGTVGLLSWAFGGSTGLFTGDGVFHMLAGGLIIGAFFMATDMVTTPMTTRGKIIFAIGAGALTTLIRLKGGYPEGVCYSILLMNAVTPLIDRYIIPKKFGSNHEVIKRRA